MQEKEGKTKTKEIKQSEQPNKQTSKANSLKQGSPNTSKRSNNNSLLETETVKSHTSFNNDQIDTGGVKQKPVIQENQTEKNSSEKQIRKDKTAVLLIGDSIVRQQDKVFVEKAPKHRKRICMPGASLANIYDKCAEQIQETGKDTIHIINGGSNDIKQIKPANILKKLKSIIDLYDKNGRTLCVAEILPRMSDLEDLQDKTYIINQQIKKL